MKEWYDGSWWYVRWQGHHDSMNSYYKAGSVAKMQDGYRRQWLFDGIDTRGGGLMSNEQW